MAKVWKYEVLPPLVCLNKSIHYSGLLLLKPIKPPQTNFPHCSLTSIASAMKLRTFQEIFSATYHYLLFPMIVMVSHFSNGTTRQREILPLTIFKLWNPKLVHGSYLGCKSKLYEMRYNHSWTWTSTARCLFYSKDFKILHSLPRTSSA